MNVCDLNTGLDQLTRAMADLDECWKTTAEVWRDAAGQQFAEVSLTPLPARIKLLVTAIHELRASITQAQRELDDRPDGESGQL